MGRAQPPTPRPGDLGFLDTLLHAGRYAQLEESATRLLARDSRNGPLWKLLALSLWRQGKDPLEALQKAARLLPDDPEAHSNLGNALRARGRLEGALKSHRRAVALRPNYAEGFNNLGSTLQDLGRADEAVASYRRATALNPEFAMAHANLGGALRELGQTAEASASLRQASAASLQPHDPQFHHRLGTALFDFAQCEHAAASFRRGLEITPDSAELHWSLGVALANQGLTDEAGRCARRALELSPRMAPAMVLLAEVHSARGEFAEAQECLKRAVEVDPDNPEDWAYLVEYRSAAGGDWLAEARRVLERSLPPLREARLRFAVGRYFDEKREFAQAFGHYRQANELSKRQSERYDRKQSSHYVDLVRQFYDRQWIEARRCDSAGSERAIFIVGMWRSGTSLAEQILASHPAVHGAGELIYWPTVATQYEQSLLREEDGEGDAGHAGRFRAMADDYLQHLRSLSADTQRVVDKMGANFLHLGLIHACLPGARIIHMQRNAIDTCLSIYFQGFLPAHQYACDLDDLAHYYAEYLRLMEHWRQTLPPQTLLEVPYEQLVEDQEAWSRRMVEFAGLPWDARCLDFHRTQRTVATASRWQVRRKMHGSSVERWRNYEPFIGPLLHLAQKR